MEALTPPRAHRFFRAQAVCDEDLTAILEAARWTGSARNRQPWRLVVVRGERLRHELARCGVYAQHAALAPLVIGIAVDDASGSDAQFDAGRLAQALMSAADSLGYGTCPATIFPDENITRAGRLVGLDARWRLRWLISLGRPAPLPERGGRTPAIPQGRLALETLIHDADRPT